MLVGVRVGGVWLSGVESATVHRPVIDVSEWGSFAPRDFVPDDDNMHVVVTRRLSSDEADAYGTGIGNGITVHVEVSNFGITVEERYDDDVEIFDRREEPPRLMGRVCRDERRLEAWLRQSDQGTACCAVCDRSTCLLWRRR